jgi:hypothetical protein
VTQTTFRSDIVAAVFGVLQAQKTATPSQLRAVYTARPGSFPETPCAYIGERSETITHGSQLRTRTMTGLTVVLVDRLVDASETEDRFDDLVDLLVERFTAAYAAVAGGGSILQMTAAADTEVVLAGDAGSSVYRGCVLSFGDTFVTEGRT